MVSAVYLKQASAAIFVPPASSRGAAQAHHQNPLGTDWIRAARENGTLASKV